MVAGLFHFWLCNIFYRILFKKLIFIRVELLLEKAMAPHSSTLAWKIPWMEEPDRLQSMGSLRVGHDWATSLSLFTFMFGEGNGNPLQCSCLENPRDGGAWWAAVCGVAQSRTQLKWLSSSSRRVEERNGNAVHYSCLENLMDRGTWWATIHRVA